MCLFTAIDMALIQSSDGLRVYDAIVVVDPESGVATSGTGVSSVNSTQIWNSSFTQCYQAFVLVDPESGVSLL